MPKYIDREALGIGKCNSDNFNDRAYAEGWNAAIDIIENAPAADVVEVIRCRDCAHYCGITFGNICRRWSCLNVKNCTKPDDYCSYGIRKDGDGK